MYMIAGLCMLKLYQKRHPDINASAYSAYACLAIVIFFSVLGVVRPRPTLHTPPPTTPAGAPSQPGVAASPASPEEGQAGAEGGGFPLRLLTLALGCPHRSSARGTQRSGSSSQSSTSLPPCCSAHSSITWVAGSWVRACPGPAGVGGLGDLASQETLGLCPLTETPEESLGMEFMRPWHSCAPEGPGPCRLAQRRGRDKRVPGL